MISEKQREANRINAQKSTGPRTSEGKSVARLNAITHGMRVRAFDVLPNEDPAQFQARVDAWFEHYRPGNTVEDQLVRHAAILSWKMDRTARHENALLARWIRDAVEQADRARDDRFRRAMQQLLPTEEQVRQSGCQGDPASLLLDVIKGSAEGCRWLIARWRYLRDAAKLDGFFWPDEFEMHAARLSGVGLGPIRDPEVIGMIVANRVLISPETPLDPFRRLDGPPGMTMDREVTRTACLYQPANPADAKALLLGLVDRQIAGLETLLTERERDGDLGGEEIEQAGWISAFDASTEGDRLRRYQSSLQRELLKTLDTLDKMQRNKAKACLDSEKGDRHAEYLEPVPVSASSEATPPEVTDAPPESSFEEFLRPAIGANEAKSAGRVPVSSRIDAKRAVASTADFGLDAVEDGEWLPISCEKG